MDPENVPAAEPIPTPAGIWSRRRRLTLGLTAIALVAGGGVAIAAGSADEPSPTPEKTTAAPTKVPAGRGGVLHSEAVTSDGNGGYVTHLTQVGKIESVDDGNLTVVSDDGYRRAWTRTADTVVGGSNWSVTKNDDGSFTVRKSTGELASGQQVMVVGTLAGDEATAARIATRPDTGDLPPMITKRFGGEAGVPGMGGMPGPMGGPMGERMGGRMGSMHEFGFRTAPDGEGGTGTPGSGASPVEPSAAYRGAVSLSFT